MLIVPIGKFCLQVREIEKPEDVQELLEQLGEATKEVVKRSLDTILEAEVTKLLKRKRHGRSKRIVEAVKSQAYCRKCGSHCVRDFWRNGHYRRGVDTHWGHLEIEMPQVRCRCGGSVEVPFQTIRKGQRIWDDLAWEMQAEYGWGLSLRWIKAKEDAKLNSSLGLRTINERVQRAGEGREAWLQRAIQSFPPVVEVDGIWITLMKTTPECH